MNILELAQALITTADQGSIQKAAHKLHQTNAAISKKLSKLEEHLKVQLLERGRKGITLTEAGQRYYHEAKLALEQFKAAELSVKNSEQRPHGNLSVILNQHYANTMVLPKLEAFLKKYPDLHLNLKIAEVLPDFSQQNVDLIFGVSLPTADNIVQKRIDSTQYVLCASPKYLKQKGTPQSIAELLQHDFICHSGRKPSTIITLDHNEQITIKPKLLIKNTELIIKAAQANIGIIWTHKNMVQDYLEHKKLIPILSKHTQEKINIYAYYPHQKYQDPKIQAFLNHFSTKI